MPRLIATAFMSLCLMTTCPADSHGQPSDQERLSMAVEYFQSGKYHEALLLFAQLDKQYTLNPRFKAYIGTCQFYDHDYDNAAKTFDAVLPKLEIFSPDERSVYYYCAAESHFQLKHYERAIELFERQLLICHDNERGDALMRIGLCHRQLGHIINAQEYLTQAVVYYRKYNNSEKLKALEKEMNYIEQEQQQK